MCTAIANTAATASATTSTLGVVQYNVNNWFRGGVAITDHVFRGLNERSGPRWRLARCSSKPNLHRRHQQSRNRQAAILYKLVGLIIRHLVRRQPIRLPACMPARLHTSRDVRLPACMPIKLHTSRDRKSCSRRTVRHPVHAQSLPGCGPCSPRPLHSRPSTRHGWIRRVGWRMSRCIGGHVGGGRARWQPLDGRCGWQTPAWWHSSWPHSRTLG